ncbi:MAG: hypothetical protein IK048_04615 [Clostridia bacterium]|nr:hypothetical protein [Clostridia bacterium]
MKRKILMASLAAVLVLTMCLAVFVACNPEDITSFRLDLNDKNADYTQEYRELNSIESRNIVKVVNKDLYKNFSTGLPNATNMIAPSGKAFAGWYFDNKTYEGTEFSEYNWNRFQRDAEEGQKKYVLYARWIPQGQSVIYFDLNNKDADYTQAYRASHNNFDHRTPEFIVTRDSAENQLAKMPLLPNVSFTVPADVNFDDWYLEDGSKATLANLLAKINAGEAQIKVEAHWVAKPTINYYCSLPESDFENGKWFEFASGAKSGGTVLRESYADLIEALPTKSDIVYHRLNAPEEKYLDYSGEEAFATFDWAIPVRDEHGALVRTIELTEDNWNEYIESFDAYYPAELTMVYTLNPNYEPIKE